MPTQTTTIIKTNTPMTPIYISFHIGRGGQFNNAGHLRFMYEEDFQSLISRCSDICTITQSRNDAEWKLIDDSNCKVILQGRDAIEANVGKLEWDGEYDTDYVTTFDQLNDKELETLWAAYQREEYMSSQLKDELCSVFNKKRVNNIKCGFPTTIEIYHQDGCCTIDFDGQIGEFTREQWQEDLEERGYCPLSVEAILDTMENCGTNDKDFFAEEI